MQDGVGHAASALRVRRTVYRVVGDGIHEAGLAEVIHEARIMVLVIGVGAMLDGLEAHRVLDEALGLRVVAAIVVALFVVAKAAEQCVDGSHATHNIIVIWHFLFLVVLPFWRKKE